MDMSYDVRNFFWLTPCDIEKINGIAFGFFTENMKNVLYNEKDSLTVNGLNLEINPFRLITSLINPTFVGPLADSIEFYNQHLKKEIEVTINGINISLTNTINEVKLRGINITGVITIGDEIDGVTISGISNFAYKMNGVSIAILHNRATVAKGIQIGLRNKSTDMRGIQIGLWNTNGRRSLPFINWQFKKKKT